MQPINDNALLRQYVESSSDEAFATLVTRHINLVYSVALRHVGNPHNAEEITQGVFIILAKKAAQLCGVKILSSWLFQVTRLTANNFVRSESRRHRREQEAHMQSILNEPETEVWPKIAPLLDSAVAGLREKDRQAIVLRFYEGRNLREVGLVFGASEDAAAKRVSRALEKLRKFFSKRGVNSITAIIAGAITANSVQAAPLALAKSVTAVAVAKGAAASSSTLILVKGTMKTMTWLKTTTFAVILTNAIVSQKIVATHFDWAGRPDGWMTHSNYLLASLIFGCGFPLFFLVIGYLARFLPIKAFNIPHRDYWLAPEQRDKTFNYLFRHAFWQACFAAVFSLALQLLVIQANHQTPPHFSSPLAWVVAGCFLAATAVLILILFCHFKRVVVP
jgi:RNA polymerase sigma factor (sigma-70 family)